ncbi:hypothetical protein DY000_02038256 [Brassica cretica]|uniref:Helicase C-terminal domain-containing protein n=1 Tax=Brassica cretica TaxID=69181 RepID=A0ABQ7BMV3_BRACR|nr:hypothetical protein DY000_02038256 [Brassica cretica]
MYLRKLQVSSLLIITSDNGEFIHPTCDLKVGTGSRNSIAETVPDACDCDQEVWNTETNKVLFYGTEEAIEECCCMGLEAMPHSYSMLRYLATFPCGAVPFTAEEERPPDLTCDGAAKKYEYVRVNRIRLRISHPSIVVAAVGGQVIETKLRSLDGLSKKNSIRPFIDGVFRIEFNLLRGTGVEFLRYDGNLAQKAREKVLQGFNQIKQKIILLISKKAGRVGLNLTAASNDPWWTPAMEEEAIMRIHRIQHKRIDAMKETLLFYGTEEAIEEFPFTAEEERPPDLSCDGAAKKSEYVRV